jgi:ubiquinone/menaquinone biosynthesis C-methylase UbiE
MNTAITILLCFVSFIIVWQILIRLLRKTIHFPAPAFIGRFLDSDVRRSMQPADKIIQRSGFKPGDKVIEIGCGSGAYTLFVAQALGETGKVYALDIQKEMLAQIAKKIERTKAAYKNNIELIRASAYEIPLQNDSLDLAYMITVLQEIPDKQKVLAEARRVLKPGGIIAITEFLFDPDYPFASTTRRTLEKAHFTIEATEGSFWTYTVRARK